jgi:excisionase family DNA binding protein
VNPSPPEKRNPAVPPSTNGADQLAIDNLQHTGLTIKEASWHFMVHRRTVERWIVAGKLKVQRLPSGRARIIVEAVK